MKAPITTYIEDRIFFLRLPGNLDQDEVLHFKEVVAPVFRDPQLRGMIIHFSAVKHMDSAGIGMVLQIHNYFRKNSKKLVLCGVDRMIVHILAKAGLDRILYMVDTEQAALLELNPSPPSS